MTDRRAAVLIGPRQVGKTTMLLQVADDLLDDGFPAKRLIYFDFSDERVTGPVSPRSVVNTAVDSDDASYVFLLDEVGQSSDWSRWLKQAVDRGRHKFIVTDSSASLLRSRGAESGFGRWDDFVLDGLTFTEWLRIQAGPDETEADVEARLPGSVERYLSTSGFPEQAVYPSEDLAWLRRRLRDDILHRAIYGDLRRFGVDLERVRQLFLYLTQASGALVNVRKIGELMEPKADPRSVQDWIDRLEHTMLIQPLAPFRENVARRTFGRRKIYSADHGLVVAFAVSDPLKDPAVRGRVFETVVYRHLRALAREEEAQLFFFRKDELREIDFLMQTEEARVAIEVTSTASPDTKKLRRAREAAALAGASRSVLIHGGRDATRQDDVQLLPLETFLRSPRTVTGEIE